MHIFGTIISSGDITIHPMKKTISIAVVVGFASLLTTCKKDQAGGKSNDTTTGSSNTSDSCSATQADANAIMIFPADNSWNLDISGEPVDSNSDLIIAGFSNSSLKADFGSGLWQGAPIGIPFVVVCGNQAKIPVSFRANAYD